MVRLKLQSLRACLLVSLRRFSRWDVRVGLCVERPPVITPALTPLQADYIAMMQQLEEDASLFSDHEMRKMKEQQLSQTPAEETQDEEKRVQTAQDVEDVAKLERNAFSTASRETAADANNDQRSLDRCLAQKLVLFVKQTYETPNSKPVWHIPETSNKTGETLRQSCERLLAHFGSSADQSVAILGNAPAAVYKYKYPPRLRERLGMDGAKVFFYKAQLKKGHLLVPSTDELYLDYLWLNREELEPHCPNSKYYSTVRSILIE